MYQWEFWPIRYPIFLICDFENFMCHNGMTHFENWYPKYVCTNKTINVLYMAFHFLFNTWKNQVLCLYKLSRVVRKQLMSFPPWICYDKKWIKNSQIIDLVIVDLQTVVTVYWPSVSCVSLRYLQLLTFRSSTGNVDRTTRWNDLQRIPKKWYITNNSVFFLALYARSNFADL